MDEGEREQSIGEFRTRAIHYESTNRISSYQSLQTPCSPLLFVSLSLSLSLSLFLYSFRTTLLSIPLRRWLSIGIEYSSGVRCPKARISTVNAYHRRPSANTKLIVFHVRLLSLDFRQPPSSSSFFQTEEINVRGPVMDRRDPCKRSGNISWKWTF